VELLKDQVEGLQKDNDNLQKAVESLKQAQADLRLEFLKELTTRDDSLKEAIAGLRREIAVTNQKLENLTKHVDEWDRRWWGLVVLLVGAALSLASGLIVTLGRR
jgi:chromosome segregation ATPase